MKNSNPAFEKALALLAHPASLGAILLLLVNDHLLRRWWPSWLTGKVGDAAWLFFVPFVLAALLCWLVPPFFARQSRPGRLDHEAVVFSLAFALAGFGFILVKTVPAVTLLATRKFTALTGSPASLLTDSSDLLALPGLVLSAGLWWLKRGSFPQFHSARRLSARGLVALPLAMMVLLADAAAPDMGIQCFSRAGGKIQAGAGYASYFSTDGGLTWAYDPGSRAECSPNQTILEGWKEAPGPRNGVVYRYQANTEIQVSNDGGKTWQTSLKLAPVSEIEQLYFVKSHSGNPMYVPGPQDALADPATGNMLFAMGHQGVLIHNASGQWVWSEGGPYQHIPNFPNTDAFWLLLGGMIYLAAELSFLIYSTLVLRWTRHWIRIVVLVLAALGWLAVAIIFPPATTTSYAETATALGILAVAVLIIPLAIEQSVRLVRRAPREFPRLLGLSMAGGLLFLLPYIFWFFGILPAFSWALLFSLLLAVTVLTAGKILEKHPARRPVNEAGE